MSYGDTQGGERCILLQLEWGAGRVIFGGLSPSRDWNPSADASLLRSNLLTFLSIPRSALDSPVPEYVYMYEPIVLDLNPAFFPGDSSIFVEFIASDSSVVYTTETVALTELVVFNPVNGLEPEGDLSMVLNTLPSSSTLNVGDTNICTSR